MTVRTRLATAIILMSLAVSGATAQIPGILEREEGVTGESYPIPGSHLLREQEQAANEYLQQHPEALQQLALKKTTVWGFTVGSTHSWYAHDYTSNSEYLTNSTCRAVGANCYIFVEDSLWGTRVTQPAVDSVVAVFDTRTPANPAKGVFQTVVDDFGNPPDIDGDPRIIIFILNIRDGWNGTGGYVAGYFYGINEIAGYTGGNNAEIYYLDANPGNLNSSAGLRNAMSTTAHEFQHMVHWNYDRQEIAFVNEGCSLVSEVDCGYPIYSQNGYVTETNHYLLDWRQTSDPNVLRDYSRAARFATYLKDQLGKGVFKPIVASTLHGIAGLDAGFASFGTSRRFADILPDWWMANIVDNASVNPKYAYTYPNLPKAVPLAYLSTGVPFTTDTLPALSARYLSFKSGSGLQLTFNVASGAVSIKAYEKGSTSRVVDVPVGTEFSEPGFGTTYTEVDFVIMNESQTNSAIYTYQSSGGSGGSAELKWDTTEPTGYLQLNPTDTVCVTFDAAPGMKLDSIRVALRRAGSITGGVWRLATSGARPLAAPLAVPITASISTTPGVPYPVPWPNWSTIDLRSYSIDASTGFAVAFECTGSTGQDERVMSTVHTPSTGAYHSFTYLHNPSTGTPNWYYLSAGTDSVWIYLIRAYVSTQAAPTLLTVYPGDANNDGIVDIRDILPIGQFYGKTGPARSGGSVTWTAQQVLSTWSPSAACYADCDGNGIVDGNDIVGLAQNWFATHVGGRVVGYDPAAACEAILKEIDRQPPSAAMQAMRQALITYMGKDLGLVYDYALEQNYPNPFNPETTLRFSVPSKTPEVKLSIFNVLGELVWETVKTEVEAGRHEIVWKGDDRRGLKVGSGVYFLRMAAGPFSATKQLLLVR